MSGKPIVDVTAAYKAAGGYTYEIDAVLAAAAVMSGKPIEEVMTAYKLAGGYTYGIDAALAAAAVLSEGSPPKLAGFLLIMG
jgi:hypothetical protein